MVADAKQLTLISSTNGYRLFRYDTLDNHAAVRADGYFNNQDDTLNISVGDLIDVVVWTTTIRSGTIATYGRHIVLAVAAGGDVDLSDETVGDVTNT